MGSKSNGAVDITLQTLEKQYDVILVRNNKSNTMRFGDESVSTGMVAEFMGSKSNGAHSITLKSMRSGPVVDPLASAVSADDIDLKRLQRELSLATTPAQRIVLQQEV